MKTEQINILVNYSIIFSSLVIGSNSLKETFPHHTASSSGWSVCVCVCVCVCVLVIQSFLTLQSYGLP